MRNRTTLFASVPVECSLVDETFLGICTNPTASTFGAPRAKPSAQEKYSAGEMNDVVTPKFFTESKKGHIFNNPMDRLENIETDPVLNYYAANLYTVAENCSGTMKDLQRGTRTVGTMPTSLFTKDSVGDQYWAPVPTIDKDSLIQKAVAQSYANIDVSEVLSLVSLAESKKTVTSMGSILFRLLRIIKASATLRLNVVAKELSAKELANRWMELRYAIRPLFYETAQVINAINHDSTNDDRFTFRGYASDFSSSAIQRAAANGDLRYTLYASADREVEVRAGVLTSIKDISTLNVWGFDRIVESAWELVPFSFVVDWILNVGQTLSSWAPNFGVQQLASWYVVRDTTSRHTWIGNDVHFVSCATPSVECYASLDSPGRTRLTKAVDRVVGTNRYTLPSFNIRLDVAKLLDLVIMGRRFK